jgi:hypothetical protein
MGLYCFLSRIVMFYNDFGIRESRWVVGGMARLPDPWVRTLLSALRWSTAAAVTLPRRGRVGTDRAKRDA